MGPDWYSGSEIEAHEPAYLRPGPAPDRPTMVRGRYWLFGAARHAPREVAYWWSPWEELERQSLRAEVGGRPLWIEDQDHYVFGFEHEVPWRVPRQDGSFVYSHPVPELRALGSVRDSLAWMNVPADLPCHLEPLTFVGRPALAVSGSHGRYSALEVVRDDATGLVMRIASDQALGRMLLETTAFELTTYEPAAFAYAGLTRPYDGPRVHPCPFA